MENANYFAKFKSDENITIEAYDWTSCVRDAKRKAFELKAPDEIITILNKENEVLEVISVDWNADDDNIFVKLT